VSAQVRCPSLNQIRVGFALDMIGLVPTPLVGSLPEVCPPEFHTPIATIVRAVEEFVNDGDLTGKIAECSGENIYYRPVMEYSDEAAKFIMRNGDDGIRGRVQGKSLITRELIAKAKLQEAMRPLL
jgi:hypothetical protein